ncbi:hypothetical protein FYZ48_20180 [Gimesia chilikensis]|uniref:hypothetical protein n=1 Tax=Gimesia chilikensis TaxID=2605989 RepID=UPI0011EFDA4D|nr:hypothetical protein [Gimesia chilikensis]KAA0134824.1 hypothetical protein FYZ48_20180 [Gimesia chilikensis]
MQTQLAQKSFSLEHLVILCRKIRAVLLHPQTLLRCLIYLQCLLTLFLFCLFHGWLRFLGPYETMRPLLPALDTCISLVPMLCVCFGFAFLILFGSIQYPAGQARLCLISYAVNFAAAIFFWYFLYASRIPVL